MSCGCGPRGRCGHVSAAQGSIGSMPVLAYTPGFLIIVGIVLVGVLAIVGVYYLFFRTEK